MTESKKVKEYRKSLQDMAEHRPEQKRREAEGKAAKLGTEIYGEERKGKPDTKPGNKPRR